MRWSVLCVEVILQAQIGEEVVILLHVARDLLDHCSPVPQVILEYYPPSLKIGKAVNWGDCREMPPELLQDENFPLANLCGGHGHRCVAQVAREGLNGVDALSICEDKCCATVARYVLFLLLKLARDSKAHHGQELPQVFWDLATAGGSVVHVQKYTVKVERSDVNCCAVQLKVLARFRDPVDEVSSVFHVRRIRLVARAVVVLHLPHF
mmetsp:Transcript_80139/g.159931  ORF Transcript_80139/g.159931 Transcript_80139/m.159931 type:complete len:209 (+) Transcript_80139:576-1202(+)